MPVCHLISRLSRQAGEVGLSPIQINFAPLPQLWGEIKNVCRIFVGWVECSITQQMLVSKSQSFGNLSHYSRQE
jgi:hypothetical protein